MLARRHRLTRGSDYRTAVRRGQRFGGSRMIVSVFDTEMDQPTRFGFIVSKQVGNAVVRNTIRRRLKDACARQLPLPEGLDIVIRALPAAAAASFSELRGDVDRAVARGVR